ncbi:hypothetical protein EYS14_10075 [Alteromonadaceae bacterium M269]|nr:hypothetical protein EYS14_10075 [Alteromonadaceae bacterium M269]
MRKLLFFIALLVSTESLAAIDRDKTVAIIGLESTTAHFFVNEGLSEECQYGAMYFRINNDFGKLAYSTLLTAKTSKAKIRRIVYSIDPVSSRCTMTFVEVE